MPKLYLSELKPGMKLLKPVTNSNGMVLLSEGTELDGELIDRLHRMDLESVFIRGNRCPNRPLEEMLSELDNRFAKAESEPQMAVLKDIFREHIAGLYGNDGL